MSTCRIKTILFVVFFVMLATIIVAVAFDAENGKEPIPSFMVQGALGEVNATRLFVGRHVVLVVMDPSCSGLDPFLSWRKRLSKEEVFQTHILCRGSIGAHRCVYLHCSK